MEDLEEDVEMVLEPQNGSLEEATGDELRIAIKVSVSPAPDVLFRRTDDNRFHLSWISLSTLLSWLIESNGTSTILETLLKNSQKLSHLSWA
jgi:hypothetical protein